ncbi:MAG: RsmB/NOP family class I SAM-dependent RNA methyltransferase [Gammaproteobacteria bacterium]|nr:RsmB/NOP family class I SAM-dependent RNA methyltransferase [Gammaproteobacteria bacterium]
MSTTRAITLSADLLAAVLQGPGAADAIMERFFRAHKALGGRERGQIAEITYGCLRHYRRLTAIAADTAPVALVGAYLATVEGLSARALAALGLRGMDDLVVAARRQSQWPWPVTTSLPDWLADQLTQTFGTDEAQALARAWLESAPLDIRCNSIRGDRASLAERLRAEQQELEPTPYSPWGLRRPSRAPLFRTEAFREGRFEVQDEASQLIAPLLEVRRGERVVDFCAGAGGKTLHIGALMGNGGTLYAFDTSVKRLDRMKARIARAGLDNVRIQVISGHHDQKVKRLHGKIDRVLVDAPCSGTGTLRRSPDIKWRITPAAVARLAGEALAILTAAAQLVRPGGRLVYATCSVLAAENEDVVCAFLRACPEFVPLDTPAILKRRGIPLPDAAERALKLLPHRHGTDGFFAQAFDRTAVASQRP